MTQNLTTPVTAAQLLAAQATDAAVVTPDGHEVIAAGRIAFTLGSYEGDAAYLAAQVNLA
jgi:hypothetical protein